MIDFLDTFFMSVWNFSLRLQIPNLFHANSLFLYTSQNYNKTREFQMFSGDIEIDQWHNRLM